MTVIVGHENLDFDALGAMVLARYLYPGAQLAVVGSLAGPIKRLVSMLSDHLGIVPATEIDLNQVDQVVVVDTRSLGRIGPLAGLLQQASFEVFDHHPAGADDIPAYRGLVEEIGAATTLLVRMLISRGIVPAPEEASVAYLGIWEDTGGFSFPSTTPGDLKAAAYLLEAGAHPKVVRGFGREDAGEETRGILQELLQTAVRVPLSRGGCVIAAAKKEGYVPALAPLAHTMLDLFDAEAAFLLLELAGTPMIIARSEGPLDVGRMLKEQFGGGGHATAAFARPEMPLEQARQLLLQSLEQYLSPEPAVGDFATYGIAFLDAGESVQSALEVLRSRGYGGMPVRNDGQILGMARRRDLEKAVAHGMGSANVAGVLLPALTLPRETPLSQAEASLKQGGGRVLISDQGEVAGIFTRTDLYRAAAAAAPEERLLPQRVIERLPEGIQQALRALTTWLSARPKGGQVYLVGGAVRDAWLGERIVDADLILEGIAAPEAAGALSRVLGGKYLTHPEFGTARIELPGGVELDLAEAREESYAYPGALPKTRPAPLQRDLARRDFTVNAVAVRVWPPPPTVYDPYGGLHDLEARVLRPLHPVSFVEDPSRIVRGIRLAARLGFSFSPEALAQIQAALNPTVLQQASKSRLRDELFIALHEPYPLRVLAEMERMGVLAGVYGLELEGARPELLALEAATPREKVEPEAYLYVLLAKNNPEIFRARFGLSRRVSDGLKMLANPPADPNPIRERGPALTQAFAALYPEKVAWLTQRRRVLRGKDILELGVAPGPRVGEILRQIEVARQQGTVSGYEQELELARKLVKRDDVGSSSSSR